jgi:mRNA interferase RelE/StbE
MNQSPNQYRVELEPSAKRWLDKAERGVRRRILTALVGLAENPRGPAVKRLRSTNHYRLRVGDYRIIFELQEQRVLVLVLKIGHRREIYRN